jgi:molybdenum cofactor synthesis domain-containing protein
VRKGMILTAAQIGICATVGALKVNVVKLPVVGLVSTGNELCKPDEQDNLTSGKIRDSNKSLLYAALKSFGIQTIYDAGIANDDCDSVLKVFRDALEKCDVVISTGGVSMGDKVI